MQILKTTKFKYVNHILDKNIFLQKTRFCVRAVNPVFSHNSFLYLLGYIDMSFEAESSKENDYTFILYY